jgi:tetraacyldisaccharide 4'-kinase
LYEKGILRPRRASFPIISIGNITFGGSEKTPLVIEVLSFLLKRGFKPALITRGYKGQWENKGGILSDGRKILGSWKDSGDEPYMVAQNIPEAGVFIGKNRLASCQRARSSGFNVGVMDDGFQHRSLDRDVDIVLYDPSAKSPHREPLSSLDRAHIILVKKEKAGGKKRIPRGGKHYGYSVTSQGFFSFKTGEPVEINTLKGTNAVAFCGIARPERFALLLGKEGISPLSFLTFPDHHVYPPSSIERIVKACETYGITTVITTEKDAVKLPNAFDWYNVTPYYLKIGLDIEADFFASVLSALQDKQRK